MMEIQYKAEFDQIFLLIKSEEESNYKRKMILQNNISGFLSCKMIYEETIPYLSYDVTAKKSLSKRFSEEKMNTSDIERLFEGITWAVQNAREYLLESKNICMDPEYIFIDIDSEDIFLLYQPEAIYERGKQYRKLAEFLLDKVDHKEELGVKIAYQFYKLSKEDFFSLEAFQNFIEKERMLERKKNATGELKNNEFTRENEKNCECAGNPADTDRNNTEEKKRGSKKNILQIFSISSLFRKKKEEKIEEELRMAEQTTINDYFGEEADEKTVFFDDHFILKWKEHRFSKEYELASFPVHVGKLKGSAEIIIEDDSVSRVHAKFREQNGRIYLQDLNSTNGTYVNGKPIEALEEMEIHREDELQFGKVAVTVV